MPLLSMPPLCVNFIITIFLFIVSSPTSHGADNENYTTCHQKTYDCGEQIKEIRYPFWGGDRPPFCGVQGFELKCHGNENTTIDIENQAFRVLHINRYNMTIARADLWDNLCPEELSDTTLNFTLFDYAPYPHVLNLTLFHDCLPDLASYDQIQERSHFQCPEVAGRQSSSNISFFVEEPYPYDWYIPKCKSRIKVPVFQEALYAFWGDKHMTVEELVKQGFEADYHEMDKFHACDLCNASGGECGTDTTTNQAICFFQVQQAGVKGKKGKKREIVAVTLAFLIGLLMLGMSVTMYLQKHKMKNSQLNKDGNLMNLEQGYTNKGQKEDPKLPLFDLAVIAHSTSNFSINNKLGEGGFGPVYKGMLEGGEEIAVKRLSKSSRQGLDEFKNEVICIAKLQHRNLVKLLGYCIQGEEKMLIYEYMPNKSLDYFIFDQTRSTLLDWPTRFHIINGISRGLLYLHRDSRLRIIHRDLKASNILLDIDMNPKISDFGMARSFRGNETEANTNKVVGTYGYMSPEYVVDGLFSIKSDVFSFGVLVLEIVSGKKNRGFYHPDHHLNLLGHAWRLYKEGRSLELIDEALWDSCYPTEVLRSIHVGLLCVQQSPEDRPSMSSVVLMLAVEDILPQAKQPGFFTERNVLEDVGSSSKKTAGSVNEMTITLLNAR